MRRTRSEMEDGNRRTVVSINCDDNNNNITNGRQMEEETTNSKKIELAIQDDDNMQLASCLGSNASNNETSENHQEPDPSRKQQQDKQQQQSHDLGDKHTSEHHTMTTSPNPGMLIELKRPQASLDHKQQEISSSNPNRNQVDIVAQTAVKQRGRRSCQDHMSASIRLIESGGSKPLRQINIVGQLNHSAFRGMLTTVSMVVILGLLVPFEMARHHQQAEGAIWRSFAGKSSSGNSTATLRLPLSSLFGTGTSPAPTGASDDEGQSNQVSGLWPVAPARRDQSSSSKRVARQSGPDMANLPPVYSQQQHLQRPPPAPVSKQYHYFWNHDEIDQKTMSDEAKKILAEAQRQTDQIALFGPQMGLQQQQRPTLASALQQPKTISRQDLAPVTVAGSAALNSSLAGAALVDQLATSASNAMESQQPFVIPAAIQQQLTSMVLQLQRQSQLSGMLQPRFDSPITPAAGPFAAQMASQRRFETNQPMGPLGPFGPAMMANPMSRFWMAAASSQHPVVALPPPAVSPFGSGSASMASAVVDQAGQASSAGPTMEPRGSMAGVPVYGPFMVAPSVPAPSFMGPAGQFPGMADMQNPFMHQASMMAPSAPQKPTKQPSASSRLTSSLFGRNRGKGLAGLFGGGSSSSSSSSSGNQGSTAAASQVRPSVALPPGSAAAETARALAMNLPPESLALIEAASNQLATMIMSQMQARSQQHHRMAAMAAASSRPRPAGLVDEIERMQSSGSAPQASQALLNQDLKNEAQNQPPNQEFSNRQLLNNLAALQPPYILDAARSLLTGGGGAGGSGGPSGAAPNSLANSFMSQYGQAMAAAINQPQQQSFELANLLPATGAYNETFGAQFGSRLRRRQVSPHSGASHKSVAHSQSWPAHRGQAAPYASMASSRSGSIDQQGQALAKSEEPHGPASYQGDSTRPEHQAWNSKQQKLSGNQDSAVSSAASSSQASSDSFKVSTSSDSSSSMLDLDSTGGDQLAEPSSLVASTSVLATAATATAKSSKRQSRHLSQPIVTNQVQQTTKKVATKHANRGINQPATRAPINMRQLLMIVATESPALPRLQQTGATPGGSSASNKQAKMSVINNEHEVGLRRLKRSATFKASSGWKSIERPLAPAGAASDKTSQSAAAVAASPKEVAASNGGAKQTATIEPMASTPAVTSVAATTAVQSPENTALKSSGWAVTTGTWHAHDIKRLDTPVVLKRQAEIGASSGGGGGSNAVASNNTTSGQQQTQQPAKMVQPTLETTKQQQRQDRSFKVKRISGGASVMHHQTQTSRNHPIAKFSPSAAVASQSVDEVKLKLMSDAIAAATANQPSGSKPANMVQSGKQLVQAAAAAATSSQAASQPTGTGGSASSSSEQVDPMSASLSESARVVNYFANVDNEQPSSGNSASSTTRAPQQPGSSPNQHQINVGFSAPGSQQQQQQQQQQQRPNESQSGNRAQSSGNSNGQQRQQQSAQNGGPSNLFSGLQQGSQLSYPGSSQQQGGQVVSIMGPEQQQQQQQHQQPQMNLNYRQQQQAGQLAALRQRQQKLSPALVSNADISSAATGTHPYAVQRGANGANINNNNKLSMPNGSQMAAGQSPMVGGSQMFQLSLSGSNQRSAADNALANRNNLISTLISLGQSQLQSLGGSSTSGSSNSGAGSGASIADLKSNQLTLSSAPVGSKQLPSGGLISTSMDRAPMADQFHEDVMAPPPQQPASQSGSSVGQFGSHLLNDNHQRQPQQQSSNQNEQYMSSLDQQQQQQSADQQQQSMQMYGGSTRDYGLRNPSQMDAGQQFSDQSMNLNDQTQIELNRYSANSNNNQQQQQQPQQQQQQQQHGLTSQQVSQLAQQQLFSQNSLSNLLVGGNQSLGGDQFIQEAGLDALDGGALLGDSQQQQQQQQQAEQRQQQLMAAQSQQQLNDNNNNQLLGVEQAQTPASWPAFRSSLTNGGTISGNLGLQQQQQQQQQLNINNNNNQLNLQLDETAALRNALMQSQLQSSQAATSGPANYYPSVQQQQLQQQQTSIEAATNQLLAAQSLQQNQLSPVGAGVGGQLNFAGIDEEAAANAAAAAGISTYPTASQLLALQAQGIHLSSPLMAASSHQHDLLAQASPLSMSGTENREFPPFITNGGKQTSPSGARGNANANKKGTKRGDKHVSHHYHFNNPLSPFEDPDTQFASPLGQLELAGQLAANEQAQANKMAKQKQKQKEEADKSQEQQEQDQQEQEQKPKKKGFLRRFSLKNFFKRFKKNKNKDQEQPQQSNSNSNSSNNNNNNDEQSGGDQSSGGSSSD